VALNWVKARLGVTSILLGARTESQLLDNLGAARWSLTQEEIDSLDRVSQLALRYPVSAQQAYGAERNPPMFKRFG
jgi:aryl-alcohol dehydrogenase-like predicted oxidoreductase